MARDPHEAVDLAPAWLNFNNSNKKKSDKSSGIHSLSQSSTLSLAPSLRSPQEQFFRTTSLGLRNSGSPLRSSSVFHSPSARSGFRHQSADFSPSYLENKNDYFTHSPGRDNARTGAFSPTLPSSKREFSIGRLTYLTKNGPHHHKSGGGDSTSGMDKDFPSLSDMDFSEQSKTKVNSSGRTTSNTVGNVWQKPLVLRSKETPPNTMPESAKSPMTSSIYKTLVPKMSVSHQKQPYRRTLSVPLVFQSKNGNSNGELSTRNENSVIKPANLSVTGKLLTANTSSLRQARSELQSTVEKTAAVDIEVVVGHKKHRKGKNHFLNALRQTEESGDGEVFKDKVESNGLATTPQSTTASEFHPDTDYICIRNLYAEKGNGESDVTPRNNMNGPEDSILSSSLEAEHRFLREMGWKCSDEQAMEEEPPLTEDEIQEFKMRCNGLLSTSAATRREKSLQNAFSGWKFSGIRKTGQDADQVRNIEAFFPLKQENGCSQKESEQMS